MLQPKYSTTNAYNMKPNVYQILSHIAVIAICIIFFISLTPNLVDQHLQIILRVIFSIEILFLVVSTVMTEGTDPTDVIMKVYLGGDRK